MQPNINIGIVGASGLVGRTILNVILERNFPFNSIKLFASAKSTGKEIISNNKHFIIEELTNSSFKNLDLVLFAAGGDISKQFVPIAVQNGCIAIDNSSHYRLHNDVPLIVPEVNPNDIQLHKGIIANPNCSTIQLVVILNALQKINTIKRIIVSTYQAVGGGGQKWLDKFHSEMNNFNNNDKFQNDKYKNDKYKIFNSIMFHSTFNENGNTNEEEKILNETRKILHLPKLQINATCVRLPIVNSHCESVNIEFQNKLNLNQIKKILSNSIGITLIDDKKGEDYPTPLLATGHDNVFVGRIRKDTSQNNSLNLWIVADNLRKGAATNAVQIAELLYK